VAGRGFGEAVNSVPLAQRFLLYFDEDSQATDVLDVLRAALMNVLTSTEARMDGQKDQAQLAFAAGAGRVIYTGNIRDFRRLNRQYQESGRSHAGMVLLAQSTISLGEQARRILRLWETVSAEEMVNREEFLSQWGEGAKR
jgi:hypothetical protein